jgi:hypothetical protein
VGNAACDSLAVGNLEGMAALPIMHALPRRAEEER